MMRAILFTLGICVILGILQSLKRKRHRWPTRGGHNHTSFFNR